MSCLASLDTTASAVEKVMLCRDHPLRCVACEPALPASLSECLVPTVGCMQAVAFEQVSCALHACRQVSTCRRQQGWAQQTVQDILQRDGVQWWAEPTASVSRHQSPPPKHAIATSCMHDMHRISSSCMHVAVTSPSLTNTAQQQHVK